MKHLDALTEIKSSLAAKAIAVVAAFTLTVSCFSISSLAFADVDDSTDNLPVNEKTINLQGDETGNSNSNQEEGNGLDNPQPGGGSDPEDSETNSVNNESGEPEGNEGIDEQAGDEEVIETSEVENAVAKIGKTTYESLQDAIAAAQAGDTVTLLQDITVDSTAGTNQATIIIPAGVTLEGNGHIITAGTFENAAHMLGVNNAADVTIKNLIIDMNKAANSKHALNVWGASAKVKLNRVELKNANTAGLVVNTGKVDSDSTITRNNGWYGINVDKKGTLTGNYNCFEEIPIYSEGDSAVTVRVYEALYTVDADGKTAVIYNAAAKAVAKIGEQLFADLPAAIATAQNGDTITLLNDVNDVDITKSATLDLNGKTINTITVAGNNKLRGVTAILKNGAIGSIEVNNKGKIDLWSVDAGQIDAADGLVAIQGGTYGDINVSGANGKLYTTSGTFTGAITFDGAGTMEIRGGKFASDVSDYCQKGYETPEAADENGMFVVHQIKVVKDEAVASTCSATGLTEGSHCSVCKKVQVAQEEVNKLAHTEEIDAAIAPSCTEAGLTEGKHCSVCNETIVAQEEVVATGHTEEVVSGKAAKCTEAGMTDGAKCSVCDEVLIEQEEIPALGHEYGEWVVTTPAAAGVAGEQQRVCAHDATHVETQVIAALPMPEENAGNQGDNDTQQGNSNQSTPANQQPTSQSQGTQAAAPAGPQANQGAPANQPTVTILDDENPLANINGEEADENTVVVNDAEQVIEDNENALASGQNQKEDGWMQWLVIPVVAIIAGILLFALLRHRKSEEEN